MQALIDKIFESKSLMFAASAVAFLVAALLLLAIFRLVVGRKLRMPGNGRTRLPRLGIVDAFDLDRQRQLVIVRRDNVEHLIMIGGPNDLVIESEIIRADIREGRIRDKEPREATPALAGIAWPPEFDAPRPAPPSSQPQRKAPFPPAVAPEPDVAPPAVAAFEEPIAPAVHAPAPRPPVFPLPPRRASPPSSPLPQRTPQREPSLGRSESKVEIGAHSSGSQRAPLATSFLRPSPPRQLLDTLSAKPTAPIPAAGTPTVEPPPPAASAAPPVAPEPAQTVLELAQKPQVEPPPAAAPSPVAPAPEAPATAPIPDPIDSLEEEMAKLLGRGPGK